MSDFQQRPVWSLSEAALSVYQRFTILRWRDGLIVFCWKKTN